MGGPTAAKPKSFLLKMRLVAPDGTPFSEKLYRVKWGNKVHPQPPLPPRSTDKDGALTMLLDAGPTGAPQGELQVIERDRASGKETVVWSIPLQIADDPPASALPALEPPPTPPAVGASQDMIQQFNQAMVEYRARVVAQLRERLFEFFRAWQGVENIVTFLPLPPLPTASDDELWEAWRLLMLAYALILAGYEASWRLWNLADLPLPHEPSFPFMGSDYEMLLHALDRFAYRHGLPPLQPREVIATMLPVYLEKTKEVHDRRGRLIP